MARLVSTRIASLLDSPRLPLCLSLLAVLLTLPSLGVGLQFDDYLLEQTLLRAPDLGSALRNAFVFMDGDPSHAQASMDAGIYPWFSLPEGKVAFWRPLSALTHWLDFRLWPNAPALMHAQNILWFAVGIGLVTLLYRELLPAPAAGLAALLFAVDDAHGYAVGWISNRNALMAFALGVGSLLWFHRFNQTRHPALLFGSAVALALSLLSAEAGIAAAGYLAAYVFFMGGSSPRKWLDLLPHALILLAWMVFYRLGDYGGWGTSYIDPLRETVPFLRAVLERAPVLWLGWLAYPPAELYPFAADPLVKFVWIFAGIALTAIFFKMIFPLVRRDRNLHFLLAGAALATLPVCSSLPANRLLFFMGLGGAPVLAAWLYDLGGLSFARKTAWFIHLGLAVILLPWMSYSPKAFGNIESAILAAPIQPTVVIVSAPSAFHADFFGLIRRRYGADVPARVWNLGAGLSPLSVYRRDENTLVVTARDGYVSGFDSVFRGGAHPMLWGEAIFLNGMQATVRGVRWDGRPSLVEFRFAEPLEDPNYQWLAWGVDGLVEWRIPAVGERVSVP
jgi:hypothetical protein